MPRAGKPGRRIDILTPADYEILELGKTNPNYITDYYFRTPTGGTRWMKNPDPPNERKSRGWASLFSSWQAAGKPNDLWEFNDVEFVLEWDAEGLPIFWHQHGWIAQGWQQDWMTSKQDETTVIGGVGSGKTAVIAVTLAKNAMSIPNYRGFAVAPQMIQANEVYKYLLNNFRNTPWFNRFVWNYPQKPYPMFVLRNDYIGESTIEIISIEKDPQKVLTLEGDEIFLDQAEKIQDLDEVVKNLGTRLRGQINGREKLGKLHLVANAGDNDALWERFEMEKWEPDVYKSYNPGSFDNQYLSDRDIARFKRDVGGSEQQIDQWMRGARPPGAGEHFPGDMVRDNIDTTLDNLMNQGVDEVHRQRELNEQIFLSGGRPNVQLEKMPEYQYVKKTERKYGVYQWELPPDHQARRSYIVIGDPGQGNAPDRNSAPIMVWDVSDFPARPAVMRAFHWVSGKNSYWPFFNEYKRYVETYHAQGQNGFDSTGIQKGFDELVYVMQDLHAEGLNMAGNGKYLALNAAKMFLGKGLMRYPYISGLNAQLTGYKLPDTKIKQDLVMCFCMSALYMRRYYWEGAKNEDDEVSMEPRIDRRYRPPKDRRKRNPRLR